MVGAEDSCGARRGERGGAKLKAFLIGAGAVVAATVVTSMVRRSLHHRKVQQQGTATANKLCDLVRRRNLADFIKAIDGLAGQWQEAGAALRAHSDVGMMPVLHYTIALGPDRNVFFDAICRVLLEPMGDADPRTLRSVLCSTDRQTCNSAFHLAAAAGNEAALASLHRLLELCENRGRNPFDVLNRSSGGSTPRQLPAQGALPSLLESVDVSASMDSDTGDRP